MTASDKRAREGQARLKMQVADLRAELKRRKATEYALRRELGPYITASAAGLRGLERVVELISEVDLLSPDRVTILDKLGAIVDLTKEHITEIKLERRKAQAIERERLLIEYDEAHGRKESQT